MKGKFCPMLSLILILITTFACAIAEATTTGSIRGIVSDSEGNSLPGATVTISSGSLIGATRTTYTNALGVFRFPSLPVGIYSVQVSLEGFDTIHINRVEVNLDATANVPVNLKILTTPQAMTILGEAPILDVTDSGFSSNYKD